jgi:hypothetical protein
MPLNTCINLPQFFADLAGKLLHTRLLDGRGRSV